MCLLSGIVLLMAVTTVFHLLFHHERAITSLQVTTPIHQQLIPFHTMDVMLNNQTAFQVQQVDQGELYSPATKKYLWRVIQYRKPNT